MYWMYNFWREAESRPKDSGYLLFLSPSCFSLLFPFLPNTRALLFNSLSSFLLTADYAIFLHKLKIFSESTPLTVTANLFLSTWEKKQPLMAIQRPSPLPAEIGGFSESRSVTCLPHCCLFYWGIRCVWLDRLDSRGNGLWPQGKLLLLHWSSCLSLLLHKECVLHMQHLNYL